MIISFAHSYVFIKTRKVAGSSVEIYLRQSCGPGDIITPMGEDDEKLAVEFGARAPSDIARSRARPWQLGRIQRRKIVRDHTWPKVSEWWSHQPASSIKRRLTPQQWAEMTKFTIVRNPWDRVVSSYFWRQHRRGSVDIDEVISEADQNWKTISINGELVVDHVVRFERLKEDLSTIAPRLGIPIPVELPRSKTGLRPQGLHYRDFLTTSQANRIAEVCRAEIDLFGYQF